MQYLEVTFTVTPFSDDACALLMALAGEAGFESFEETSTGVTGYVQRQLFSADVLDSVLADFPLPGTGISYTVADAPDADWNEQWEQEGFEPIAVNEQLTIHDGRHLPETATPIMIEIDARLAFGTGNHETTRMICRLLLGMRVDGLSVLDCGCGTGILGICAIKAGASHVVAYDIDEWSVENTRHNAVINGVSGQMEVLHGDAGVTEHLTGCFDLVLANINRNILVQDMPRFVDVLKPAGRIVISGFYTSDVSSLTECATSHGLTVGQSVSEGDWAAMLLVRQ